MMFLRSKKERKGKYIQLRNESITKKVQCQKEGIKKNDASMELKEPFGR